VDLLVAEPHQDAFQDGVNPTDSVIATRVGEPANAPDVWGEIDAEIDAYLAEHRRAARTALCGAALRGDRAVMSEAAERLAALDSDTTAVSALAQFFHETVVIASTRYGDSPRPLGFDLAQLEQLPLAALQELAHRAAVLAYAAPSTSPDARRVTN